MNRFLQFLVLTITCAASSLEAADTYINNGVASVGASDPIDATNFINNNRFYATNDTLTGPYYTYNTLTYSNRGFMSASFGFRFDQTPSSIGPIRMADTFVNANLVNETNCTIAAGISLDVFATNIINKGILEVTNSVLRLTGKNIDLSRGSLRFVDSGRIFFGTTPTRLFDQYWGTATNMAFGITISNSTIIAAQSTAQATNLINGVYGRTAGGVLWTNPAAFVYTNQVDPTNIYKTIVLINNSNAFVSVDVRFLQSFGSFATPVVQWSNVVVNPSGVGNNTNLLYLTDDFGVDTNLAVFQNGFGVFGAPSTYAPINYFFSQTSFTNSFQFLQTNNASLSPSLFNAPPFPFGSLFFSRGNSVSYGVTLSPITFQPESLSLGASVVNQPGRIEVRANQITMNKTRIDALNYLALSATNHFSGSSNAFVTVPYSDISLATTNGVLNITNLISPYVPRMVGEIHLWSGRWTNVDANDVTNYYQVLMVDTHLNPKFPSKINTLSLRSTNIFLSDTLNVQSNLFIGAQRLTLTTNVILGSGGEINIENPSILLADSLPNLQYLTNFGRISSVNNCYLGASQPLQVLVNRGAFDVEGLSAYTSIFENSGTIRCRGGAFDLHASFSGMTNGQIITENSDLVIQSASLTVSGHVLKSGRKLTLDVSSFLSDSASLNSWECHDGFSLLSRPASGDLFYTTVTNFAFDNAEVVNAWAMADRGASPDSFTNSATIGRLVLDGGVGSQFDFVGTSTSNAMYIDYLELTNNATNIGSLYIDPNIKLYVASASPLSPEKLNLFYPNIIWASGYKGLNSSTTLTLRNGQTVSVNSSLPGSTTMDSDGDGVPNSIDPFPLDGLQVAGATNVNLQTVSISWYADSASWQYVIEYSTDLTHWSTLTTVISGPVAGQQMTYQDSLSSGVHRFYRVSTLSH